LRRGAPGDALSGLALFKHGVIDVAASAAAMECLLSTLVLVLLA
jgi:hypothetical protein